MFKHYLIIAWRNIIHHRFYSIILVIGLALGIATSVLLGIYTLHELSYDAFHEKKDRTGWEQDRVAGEVPVGRPVPDEELHRPIISHVQYRRRSLR